MHPFPVLKLLRLRRLELTDHLLVMQALLNLKKSVSSASVKFLMVNLKLVALNVKTSLADTINTLISLTDLESGTVLTSRALDKHLV